MFRLPRGRRLEFGAMPLVMAIINVTPDSFSDGGVNFDEQTAVENALQAAKDGADILDVGGESTRPGSSEVTEDEELRRVIPVIRGIRAEADVAISIDTRKSRVAEAALAAGADIVNDVSALRHDPRLSHLVAESGVPVILMHMRGEPKTMQQTIHFQNLMQEIRDELAAFVDDAVARGIDASQISIDPGIGFGKTFEQNAEILQRLDVLTDLAPLTVGASRKAFIGELTGQPGGAARMPGSLATVAAAALGGAAIVRVHDVRPTIDFLRVFSAVTRPRA